MNGVDEPGAGLPGGDGDSDAAPPPPAPVPTDERVHLYEAVSARRDGVLKDFDNQRAALIKAVEEQRMAAIPPSLRGAGRPIAGLPGMMPDMAPARRPVMQEIALTLRAIIAEEVRTQLASTLAALAQTPVPPRE